jgi:ABC-type molybdenum transport system ATPase subunit/photorepair protein PhrA
MPQAKPAAFFVLERPMIAIGLSNISLVLGARPIFTSLNWEIQTDQRIGLIGPNGTRANPRSCASWLACTRQSPAA